jgi:hypothetical protein
MLIFKKNRTRLNLVYPNYLPKSKEFYKMGLLISKTLLYFGKVSKKIFRRGK